MDYKKMYYSLFNQVSDLVYELEGETAIKNMFVIDKLKQIQINSEELYLELSKKAGKAIDIEAVKRNIKNRVG